MNQILEDAGKLNVQSPGVLKESLLIWNLCIGSISQPPIPVTIHALNLINQTHSNAYTGSQHVCICS